MGLLDELIILVKETIEDAQQQGRPDGNQRQAAPQRSPEEIEALRRTLARRAAEARLAEEQAAERAAADQQAEQERQRQAQHRELQRQRQQQAEQGNRIDTTGTMVDHRHIARLIRRTDMLRQVVVLREILDKPLALRRR